MSRPRLTRYLRIAFSAVCGITCVLLLVRWMLTLSYPNFKTLILPYRSVDFCFPIEPPAPTQFWLPIILVSAMAAAPWLPWIRWRYSLKTLLIATTLVAVVLGLIVWAVRR